MEKNYQPQKTEEKIYRLWEKAGIFKAKISSLKKPFSIIMPPPNANAPLHIGHAMFITIEDILARYQRMKGKAVLLLPGADHAGILTQVVFERKLAQEGKTRFELGREKFFKECFAFTQKNKKIMYQQFKKVGASCDWSREKFTLDEKISQQVLLTFVQLYQDGLAYRKERLINWCPRCMTALSDLEVEYHEIPANLWFIKYPLKTSSEQTEEKRFLIVATTRPETILGDTALAVNPKDKRYQNFIGQKAIVPFVNREIPIIADEMVDPEFGTGVLKITPAHDFKDWQVGLKHHLELISVIGFDNKMLAAAGKDFVGLNYLEARKKIINKLSFLNLLVKTKKILHEVAHCERCKTIIEPLVSTQWFINVNKKIEIKNSSLKKLLKISKASLKDLGILAIKKKLIKILPKRFEINYLRWLENLQDWCVSRQIWWGHQMPIWYCGIKGLSELQKKMNPHLAPKLKKNGCGYIIVSLEKPKICPQCGGKNIIQDPDTFDCWFSSGQWPYTTLGFPEGKDFKYWYPTTIMETGYEILFPWVARMIMLGMYRTGNIPFQNVYLHGLVRDAFGQKMSKSKGNVIDPLQVIEKYGADSLRLSLIAGNSPGNDISLSEERIRGYRNFCNKVWNIGRFIYLNCHPQKNKIKKINFSSLQKDDKEALKKLKELIKKVTKYLEEYRLSFALEETYQFLWHYFADKYLEKVKNRIREKNQEAIWSINHIYRNCLKLLHPFIPFLTEILWQQLYTKEKNLLANSKWPS